MPRRQCARAAEVCRSSARGLSAKRYARQRLPLPQEVWSSAPSGHGRRQEAVATRAGSSRPVLLKRHSDKGIKRRASRQRSAVPAHEKWNREATRRTARVHDAGETGE